MRNRLLFWGAVGFAGVLLTACAGGGEPQSSEGSIASSDGSGTTAVSPVVPSPDGTGGGGTSPSGDATDAAVSPSPDPSQDGGSTATPSPDASPTDSASTITVDLFTFPSTVKVTRVTQSTQVVMTPDWEKAPFLTSERWELVSKPAGAVTFFDNPVDPSGVLVTPSFVPTGKAKTFTITVQAKKESFSYKFELVKGTAADTE